MHFAQLSMSGGRPAFCGRRFKARERDAAAIVALGAHIGLDAGCAARRSRLWEVEGLEIQAGQICQLLRWGGVEDALRRIELRDHRISVC